MKNFFILISITALLGCHAGKIPAVENTATSKPVAGGIIWGSSAAPFPGEDLDRVAAWKRLNEKIKSLNGGYGLHARRTYDRGIPSSWSASAMADDIGLCKVSLGSIKPNWKETASGSNFEAIKKFVQSVPDNHTVYLVFNHEPEDEIRPGGNTATLLQEAFAKFVEAVVAAGKPNVHPTFVLMSYTFRPQSGRNPQDFNMAVKLKPEYLDKVVAAVDGYAKTPDVRSAEETFEPCMKIMASWGFARFGIFETGTQLGNDAAARVKWIQDLGKWATTRKNVEVISWFHSGVGQNAGPVGWYLGYWTKENGTYRWEDRDGSIKAYADLVKATRGV